MADPQSPQTRYNIDPLLGIFILIGVVLGAAIAVIVSDSTDGAWTGILIGAGVGIVAQIAYGQWRKRQPARR